MAESISAGLFALMGAALIMLLISRWTRMTLPGQLSASPTLAVFLYRGQDLVDASPAARRFLRGSGLGMPDLAALLTVLSRIFGADLAPRMAALPPAGRLHVPSAQGDDVLDVAEEGGALRLTLRLGRDGGTLPERIPFESASEELAPLRGIAEDAPQPIWAMGADGQVVWANRAYLALADLVRGLLGDADGPAPAPGPPWPAAPLFAIPAGPPEDRILERRETLVVPGREEPMWFDVTTVRRGSGTLSFASDVGGLVLAESARLHFVQALTKTFAHLSTGLAIFDRQRRLVLFNPAFVDLTGLPIVFLSGRPLVHSVLDRLREAKILPEPPDYANWREEVAALEAAAAQGQYADTWSLPSGRTYRVTGRPHPDGALAFLFEDITVEVGQTRRLRAELDAVRAALNAMGEAVAAFGMGDALVLSNSAYDDLWGPPGGRKAAGDFQSQVALWEARCAPSPLWAELRAAPHGRRHQERLRRLDGSDLVLRLAPLPRGATLVTFQGLDGCQDHHLISAALLHASTETLDSERFHHLAEGHAPSAKPT